MSYKTISLILLRDIFNGLTRMKVIHSDYVKHSGALLESRCMCMYMYMYTYEAAYIYIPTGGHYNKVGS